jgi:hypothetical protein
MFGFIKSIGNLSAIEPPFAEVSPIFASGTPSDLASVGQLVKFDLTGGAAPRADASLVGDTDNKRNPFNVVIAATTGSATSQKGGIWGIVTHGGRVGDRIKVCVFGVVQASVTTTVTTNPMTAGDTVLVNGAGVLVPAPATAAATTGAPLAIGFDTVTTTTTQLRTVFFNGFSMAIGGA